MEIPAFLRGNASVVAVTSFTSSSSTSTSSSTTSSSHSSPTLLAINDTINIMSLVTMSYYNRQDLTTAYNAAKIALTVSVADGSFEGFLKQSARTAGNQVFSSSVVNEPPVISSFVIFDRGAGDPTPAPSESDTHWADELGPGMMDRK